MLRKIADRWLKFFCHPDYYPDIKGDLEELYPEQKTAMSDWTYLREVILLTRPSLMRNFSLPITKPSNQRAMFKNYLKVAFRQIDRNRIYSLINISGFSLGIASCILIFFYVKNETSFDDFHSKKDSIYKVTTKVSRETGESHYPQTPPALAPAIGSNLPEIIDYSRLRLTDERLLSNGSRSFYEKNGFYADSTFLEIFDFGLMEGDISTALDRPNTIVLTKETAEKYFDKGPFVGKQLLFDNRQMLEITGILSPIPPNSHIQFDYLLSFSSFQVPEGYLANLESWSWMGFETYILTQNNVNTSALEEKLSSLFMENFKSRTGLVISANMQPLTDIYLGSADLQGAGNEVLFLRGDERIIKGLSAIAFLILFIACINFTNLSTAMSLKRGREVGVRKSLGALRGKLVTQFMFESLLLGIISLVFALIILLAGNQLILNALELPLRIDPGMLLQNLPYFISGVLIVSIIAGLYPSKVMSGFNPIAALKGKIHTNPSKRWIQKTLIVFQFSISISLIAGSLIVITQINFMNSSSLGYDKEHVLLVNIPSTQVPEYYESIVNEMKSNPDVINITNHNNLQLGNTASHPIRLKTEEENKARQISYFAADYEFLETLGIELKQGRFFSKDILTDTTEAIVLNESALELLGIQEDPIGKEVVFVNQEVKKVVGVIEDFHYLSLHKKIGPLALVIPFTNIDAFMIKLRPNHLETQLSQLEMSWKKAAPHLPFDYSFLDSRLEAMYDNERKLGKLIPIFSALAVFLACLGLYGLVALTIQARVKEIGIRKVLGSSIQEILLLLSRQYVSIILVSLAIAWPATWYFAAQWLNDFAYHIGFEWWIFLLSGLILILIAFISISSQLIKAAKRNPVDTLKIE